MGRWAEVYFTSPPEKREEAVLELLRELESGEAAREGAADSRTSIPEQVSVSMTFPASRIAKVSPRSMRCQSCGRENPVQKFCGMCGVRLEESNATAESIENPPTQGEAAQPGENRVSHFSSLQPAVDAPHLMPRESVRFLYSELASRPYRLYIGTAFVILVIALCYIGWRGTQATSESSPAEPQTQVTATTATPTPVLSMPIRNASRPAPSSRADHSSQAAPQATAIADPKASQTLSVSGSEELATALSYLNGANGKEKNSEEAVQWLWKAVAKRNADATLRLADLYLKGDGVPKNCDQARVLLDAAASRGISGAAERLRDLQSFDCE